MKKRGTIKMKYLKIKRNLKVSHDFFPRPLIFKLHQEVLKFNDTYMSWSSRKADLVTNILNLENRSLRVPVFLNLRKNLTLLCLLAYSFL